MAINYNNIGRIYKDQDIYGKAAEYYLKALKINEEIGNKKGISDSYSGIGGVYSSNGNYDKALENYFNSLKITENSSDKIGMLNCYIFIGDNYRIQCLYDKSLEYFSMALKISEEIGSQRGLSSSYYGIGIIYYRLTKLHRTAVIQTTTYNHSFKKLMKYRIQIISSIESITVFIKVSLHMCFTTMMMNTS